MCEFVSGVVICFLVVFLFVFTIKLIFEGLKAVLLGLKAVLLWVTGAKDLAELGVRFDKWMVESHERQLEQRRQCGFPLTFRGRLGLERWRLKKSFAHPVRYFLRGEFRYPTNKRDSPAKNLQE